MFAIDEPHHKRWLLPDGKHWYNSFIYGNLLHISILDRFSGKTVTSLPAISLDDPQWENLAELALALAERKYRKATKRQINGLDYMKSYRR